MPEVRFHFESETRPKRVAKALRAALAEHGLPATLGRAQELTARLYGHPSWYALHADAGKSAASPLDEDAGAAEAERRRRHHIDTLTASGVPDAIAAAVVDTIKPTGSRAATDGTRASAGWRKDLDAARNPAGFIGHDPVKGMQRQVEYFHSPGKKRSLDLGDGWSVRVERTSNLCAVEGIPFQMNGVDAWLIDPAGTEAGILWGCVLLSPDGPDTGDDLFYEACDAASDHHAGIARSLLRQYGSAARLFMNGGLFVLQHWQVRRGMVPAGTGVRFLRAVLADLKRSYRALAAVAVDLKPQQYAHDTSARHEPPTGNEVAARAHLRAYWDSVRPETALGPRAKTLHFTLREYGSPDEALLGLGAVMSGADVDDERLAAFAARHPFAEVMSELVASYRSRKDAGQREAGPRPGARALSPAEYPAGWHPLEGGVGDGSVFDPAPDFWSHMPADLDQIDIEFREPEPTDIFSMMTHTPAVIRYRFTSGAALETRPTDYGRSKRGLVNAVVAPRLSPDASNEALWKILNGNAGLLFRPLVRAAGPHPVRATLRRDNAVPVVVYPRDLTPASRTALLTVVSGTEGMADARAAVRAFVAQARIDGYVEAPAVANPTGMAVPVSGPVEVRRWPNPAGLTARDVVAQFSPRLLTDIEGEAHHEPYLAVFMRTLAEVATRVVRRAILADASLRGQLLDDLGYAGIDPERDATDGVEVIMRCMAGKDAVMRWVAMSHKALLDLGADA